MIRFHRTEAALVNPLLKRWEHYLDSQDGPRMVLWYALFIGADPVSVAVSASPRGARCGGRPWAEVVELARLCSAPEHRDMTRVCLRLWRKLAASDWVSQYPSARQVTALAAYSDSTRHPGNIYRFDGWTLYDERVRGSGGVADRGESHQAVARKKLWVFPLERPAQAPQLTLDETGRVGVRSTL